MSSIHEVLEGLDESGLTITVLKSLDSIVPGQWTNITNFEEMIRVVTEEDDEVLIQQVGERAIELYADPDEGYQRAVSLFSQVDGFDKLAGSAAIAAKLGEKFSLLRFLDRVTPDPDKTQAVDAGLKFAAELSTFCLINGKPGDSITDFAKAVSSYAREDKMRLVAWLAIDCVLPLGPDFYTRMHDGIANMELPTLADNALFRRIAGYLPGSDKDKKDVVTRNLEASSAQLESFVKDNEITRDSLLGKIREFVDVSDSKLDYLSAMLDMSTNYYRHTGVQSVARQLVSRAYGEI